MVNKRLKRNNIIVIFLMLIEIICILIYFELSKFGNDTFKKIGIISFICFIISSFSVFAISRKANFFFFFIILSYLFSFGQSILVAFGFQLPKSVFSITYSGFSINSVVNAAMFSLLSICMLIIGFCLVNINSKNRNEKTPNVYGAEKLCSVANYLLIISIFPTFYLLIKDIRTTFSIGYGNTLVAYTGINRIFSLLAGFFVSSLLILILYEKKPSKRLIIYCLLIVYCVLQILGGSRIEVFRLGFILFVIENQFFINIDWKKAIYIVIAVLIAGFVFSVVSAARVYLYSISDISTFIKMTARNIWKNNFLVSSLREMGNTQIVNTLVMDKCPRVVPFQYGLSFVKILWAILPNFIGNAYTGYIGVDITFSPLYGKTSSGLGASFISEGYWNFGWFAFIYFVLLGLVFGLTEKRFAEYCSSDDLKASSLFLIVYFMYYMIFMVRSEMLGLGRSFVYYALIPVLLSKIKVKNERRGKR